MIQMADTHNHEPLDLLIKEHSAGVFRYLRSLVGDEEAARDLLHDAIIKLSSRADDAGQALVYTVARSCALDHLRRQRTRQNHLSHSQSEVLNHQPTRVGDRPDHSL